MDRRKDKGKERREKGGKASKTLFRERWFWGEVVWEEWHREKQPMWVLSVSLFLKLSTPLKSPKEKNTQR